MQGTTAGTLPRILDGVRVVDADTDAVLEELGYRADRVAALRALGVVGRR